MHVLSPLFSLAFLHGAALMSFPCCRSILPQPPPFLSFPLWLHYDVPINPLLLLSLLCTHSVFANASSHGGNDPPPPPRTDKIGSKYNHALASRVCKISNGQSIPDRGPWNPKSEHTSNRTEHPNAACSCAHNTISQVVSTRLESYCGEPQGRMKMQPVRENMYMCMYKSTFTPTDIGSATTPTWRYQ